MRLERLFDQVGRRYQRDRAERDALAESGIDLPPFAPRQHRAELEQRAPEHRVARDHVFTHGRRHETCRRPDRHLACRHLIGADDAAHAAEVIDVAVRIDDRDHRLVRPVLQVQFHCRLGDLGRDERVDHDKAGVALDDRHVRYVEAAELVHAIRHAVQAVGHVDAGVAPQPRMDAVGRQFAFEKLVTLERPYQPAVGARDQLVAQRFDKAAPRIFKRLPIRKRHLCNRRPICRARSFGRVFHLLSLQFPAGSKNLVRAFVERKL